MPVAIICFTDGTIPAILSESDDAALLARIQGLRSVPQLETIGDARAWLAMQPAPSGWFDSIAEAQVAAHAVKPDTMTPEELIAIREALDMTRAEFGRALGYQGKDSNINKQVWEMERGAKPIMPAKAEAARRLMAAHLAQHG